jgi:hypothetical protein
VIQLNDKIATANRIYIYIVTRFAPLLLPFSTSRTQRNRTTKSINRRHNDMRCHKMQRPERYTETSTMGAINHTHPHAYTPKRIIINPPRPHTHEFRITHQLLYTFSDKPTQTESNTHTHSTLHTANLIVTSSKR